MSQDQKQEAIIEAAVKRFAHFGVGKTTMTEIANDLSISKALLYYYFPDKLSLYAAVLKHITQIDAERDEEQLRAENDPWLAIQLYLDIRTAFIIKYHNLLEHLQTFAVNNMPKELESVFSFLKQREMHRITYIIEKGKQSKLFKIKDVKKAAELYYDFLEGFRYAFFNRKPNFFPDKKQFQAILRREKEYSVIFFNGLSCKNDF
jgi:TetR/AcrR family transcriptional repressor of mexJK operon